MALTSCRECRQEISTEARACPYCGAPFPARAQWKGTGIDWRTEAEMFGYPVVHVAFGRDASGRLRVARGIIAVGQFAIGAFTFAQFGIGIIFGFGQFIFGLTAAAQVAVSVLFGVGQFATGYVAVGQVVLAYYGLAQVGLAQYLWTPENKDPEAVEFFLRLAERLGLAWPAR